MKHNGSTCPLASGEGAVVKLRSGSKAIVTPSTEKYDLQTQVIWHSCGDENDIVSYSVISSRSADRVVEAVTNYLDALEETAADGLSEHSLTKHVIQLKRRELSAAIAAYKKAWLDWPETTKLKQLRGFETE
ncbi:hypothetical protein [Pontixanthobacter sp.]|uniref:hypothetical protein n=1 Tax=Pontixanthobacter sp. TaxID=2792078 RepID=UPI003C7D038B